MINENTTVHAVATRDGLISISLKPIEIVLKQAGDVRFEIEFPDQASAHKIVRVCRKKMRKNTERALHKMDQLMFASGGKIVVAEAHNRATSEFLDAASIATFGYSPVKL